MASPTASSAVTSEPASVMYCDPVDAPSVVCACAPPRRAATASAIVALFAPAMRRRNETREGMSARDLRRDGGGARDRRVAIHMRSKRHTRDRDRRRSGERVAPRSGRGTRGGARVDRDTTYRAWREGCVCFSGACAGEWRGDAHGTSPSELRSEGRRRNVCRHTPKAKPKQRRACREIPGVIRPSRTRCGKPRNFSRETADQRVADWRRERTHESGFRFEMRSIGKAFRSTSDQIERGS